MSIFTKNKGLTILLLTLTACLIYGLNGGIRSNYGIMLGGIIKSTGLSYEAVSLVMAAAQLSFGLTQPLFGIVALKKSNKFVLCLGASLVAAGLVMTPLCRNFWSLLLFFGILMPSGMGALSFGIIMGAITPILGQKKAAAVSGIVSASSGLGSIILAPVVNLMLEKAGLWGCMLTLALPALCLIPISSRLDSKPGAEVERTKPASSISAMLKAAFSSKSYYLLLFAFFTCGFHMAIIETHLFTNMTTAGISASTAAYLFSLYGITTILGSIITGSLSSRLPIKLVAGCTFISRLFIIGSFLLLPKTTSSFAFFALFLGLTGSATVPPVSSLVNKLFGPACLGTLFGVLFVAHQIGSFLSAWLGAVSITSTGSYTAIWLVSAIMALLAGCACFMVKEEEQGSLQD